MSDKRGAALESFKTAGGCLAFAVAFGTPVLAGARQILSWLRDGAFPEPWKLADLTAIPTTKWVGIQKIFTWLWLSPLYISVPILALTIYAVFAFVLSADK